MSAAFSGLLLVLDVPLQFLLILVTLDLRFEEIHFYQVRNLYEPADPLLKRTHRADKPVLVVDVHPGLRVALALDPVQRLALEHVALATRIDASDLIIVAIELELGCQIGEDHSIILHSYVASGVRAKIKFGNIVRERTNRRGDPRRGEDQVVVSLAKVIDVRYVDLETKLCKVDKLFLLDQMAHILQDYLAVVVAAALPTLAQAVAETVECRLSLRALFGLVGEITDKNAAVDSFGDNKARSAQSEGCHLKIDSILAANLNFLLISVVR